MKINELFSDILMENTQYEFKAVLNQDNPVKWAKTIVAFATSGGSPIGKTAEKLAPHVKGTSEIRAVLIHNEDELKNLL